MTSPGNLFFTSDQQSLFTAFASSQATDLMSQQLSTNQPQPVDPSLTTTTDPLLPDRLTFDRLRHMDPALYDLSETSHLMRLLKVLLGSPGAGGLRKQMAVIRLANAFSGMHFLDLDRFYGALFGIKRTQAEIAPSFAVNPYTDAAPPSAWDDLHSRDASYRDRLVRFAKSIYHGGTYGGLRSMAEALIAAECEIYESWEWLDEQDAGIGVLPTQIFTYSFLSSALQTYEQMGTRTWGELGGGSTVFAGRTGQRNRSEVILQPKRTLTLDEQYEIVRVLRTFAPAGVCFSVDTSGAAIHTPIEIRAVGASSEYWDITTSVVPEISGINPYPAQVDPAARPAFSQYQGGAWNYNADIAGVSSYTMAEGVQVSNSDDETVIYTDGSTGVYDATQAVVSAAQAHAAQLVNDGALTASPYAPARAVGVKSSA